ncbi:MAG: hypothetical protein KatS3mg130_0827 [Candidatus Sumerlaea sp.]|nr:MAG: hypothetical protein KatS3mg130_0827 [Candidatus Sumerlaea sp.]
MPIFIFLVDRPRGGRVEEGLAPKASYAVGASLNISEGQDNTTKYPGLATLTSLGIHKNPRLFLPRQIVDVSGGRSWHTHTTVTVRRK